MRISSLLLLLTCFLLGCSKEPSNKAPSAFELWMRPSDKIKVLSTTQIIDNLVAEVGGDQIDHLPLMIGELDPHTYELVKGDDEKLIQAQIVFFNGLDLEHGASLRYRLQNHPQAVALGDDVHAKHPELILMVRGQRDPHIWMDLELWSYAVEPIVKALSLKRPEKAAFFERNGEQLRTKMLSLNEKLRAKLQEIPAQKRFLITSHDAFNYFARRYLATAEEIKGDLWQGRVAAPEGLAPDGQLSAADIQYIVDRIKQHRIEVVFPESNVNADALKKIVQCSKSLGISVRLSEAVLFADAMGPPGSEADSYFKMMEWDIDTLFGAWKER